MAPSYKLTYFDIPGRGEAIRMMFSYAGISFEDHRVPRDDWAKLKPTTQYGQLPLFEVDGQVFNQSLAISRYVAKLANLSGKNDIENLKIDAAVDNLMDVHNKVRPYVTEQDEAKKKTLEKSLNEAIARYFKSFEENANKNGGFFAINRLTWADIIFLTQYEMMRAFLNKDVLAEYPTLTKLKNTLLSTKGIRDWIQNRKDKTVGSYSLKQDL